MTRLLIVILGVIAIGWQTYLSLLNQRAAAEEQGAHVHEHNHKESEQSDPKRSEMECSNSRAKALA
jgi:protein Mpv17